jgi:hypothetical protein
LQCSWMVAARISQHSTEQDTAPELRRRLVSPRGSLGTASPAQGATDEGEGRDRTTQIALSGGFL